MRSIQDFEKKRITLIELQEYYHINSYTELVELVKTLVTTNQIKPSKTSGLNGKQPALYKRYQIIGQEVDETPVKEKLMCLSSLLNIDYYIKHLDHYKEDERFIGLLDEYLKKNQGRLKVAVSNNERSFEIFGREKFISKEGGKKLLKNLGMDLHDLNIYETTEPLAYYSNHKNQPQTLLIIENKDTFYSMRKHLIEENELILGKKIGTLIYGGGKAIYKSFQDFNLCVEPYMNCSENEFLYFGDLDYEGILIYETLCQMVIDQKKIRPFVEAYERMFQKAEQMREERQSITLPKTKEGQNRNCGDVFFSYFVPELQAKFKKLLAEDRYIPQEILQCKDI